MFQNFNYALNCNICSCSGRDSEPIFYLICWSPSPSECCFQVDCFLSSVLKQSHLAKSQVTSVADLRYIVCLPQHCYPVLAFCIFGIHIRGIVLYVLSYMCKRSSVFCSLINCVLDISVSESIDSQTSIGLLWYCIPWRHNSVDANSCPRQQPIAMITIACVPK